MFGSADSVRAKLIRTTTATLAAVTFGVLAFVAWRSVATSRTAQAAIERQIRDSIATKGRDLVENHASALRSLVADNAFSDVDGLVRRTVGKDDEIVYGLFLGPGRRPWSFVTPNKAADADPNAWKALGISEESLSAATLQTRTLTAFGEEVFEFSAPVLGEDGVMGSIRYGISSRRLTSTLDEARQEARRALRDTLAILVLLGLGGFALGSVLARRAAARITGPITALTDAARKIAAGHRGVQVNITSGDETEALGAAFNKMVADLSTAYAELESLNKGLERQVQERTRELDGRNRDMRLVLDNVDQGFITVDLEGRMSSERSAVVDTWFGAFPEGRTGFAELAGRLDPTFAAMFKLSLEQLREGALPVEVCLDAFPTRLRSSTRQLRCEYRAIEEAGVVVGLLVMMDDVTESLARERQEAEQKEMLALFSGLQRDRVGVMAFLEEAEQLVRVALARDSDLDTRRRALHTLKGNAGLAGLAVVAELCHQLEEQLQDEGRIVEARFLPLKTRWTELMSVLSELLGGGGKRSVQVDEKDYEELIRELERVDSSRTLAERLRGWRLEPIARPLERLTSRAKALAARLGKGAVTAEIVADSFRVDPERTAGFFAELNHLIRNAIDHGFEDPDERAAAGKRPELRLRLEARLTNQWFLLRIQDDGRGIDWNAVAARARSRGLPARTEGDLLAALLAGGISTKATATEISGRGIGLSALYRRLLSEGGTIGVNSERGKRTTWEIRLPASFVTSPAPPARAVPPAIPRQA